MIQQKEVAGLIRTYWTEVEQSLFFSLTSGYFLVMVKTSVSMLAQSDATLGVATCISRIESIGFDYVEKPVLDSATAINI